MIMFGKNRQKKLICIITLKMYSHIFHFWHAKQKQNLCFLYYQRTFIYNFPLHFPQIQNSSTILLLFFVYMTHVVHTKHNRWILISPCSTYSAHQVDFNFPTGHSGGGVWWRNKLRANFFLIKKNSVIKTLNYS